MKVTSITTDDGLSQGMIFDILEDNDGFIWIGTKNGLNRFDGYDFKVFTHDPFDSLSISGNVITVIFEDSKGRLWIGTESRGLNYFDKEKEVFYSVKTADSNFMELETVSVVNIVEDAKGKLWVASKNNVFCIKNITITEHQSPIFELEKKEIQPVKSKSNNNIGQIKIFKDGKVWIRREDDTAYWDETKKRFEVVADTTTKSTLQFFNQRNNSPLGPFPSTIKQLQTPDSPPIEVSDWQENIKYFFFNARTNEYWIIYHFKSTVFAIDATMPPIEWVLKPIFEFNEREYITKLFFENEENIWFGTNGYGIRKVNSKRSTFKHFFPNQSIRIIFDMPEKRLFLETRLVTYTASLESNSFLPVEEKYNLSKYLKKIIQTQQGEHYAIVRSFKERPFNGIHKLGKDFSTEQVFSTEDIQARYGLIQEDDAGNLWMPAQEDDFIKFEVSTGTFTKINVRDFADVPPITIFTQCLYKDGQGIFWKGVRNGLLKMVLDEKGEPIEAHFYQTDFQNRESLSNNSVSSCLDDPINPETYLWVGTKGGGLNKLNKKTGKFEHFTTKDGLPDNVVYGILADEDNTLWVSTNRGLSHFDPVKKTFNNYTKADGLQDDEFNTAAYYKNEKTGELFFGGINGLTTFFPKDLKLNTKKPKVYLTNLKIHNETVEVGKKLKERGVNPLKKAIPYTESIDLDWHQNQLTLQFAALEYDVPEKNLYQYRLSNVDNDWVRADKNRLASYANLSPGSYLFEVKATNSSGIWNETPATLQIIIHPPWWNTWWFYTALLGVLFFIIYKIYQFQIRRAKLKNELLFEQKEAERLMELNRIKTNFFSNITHEFRTPLTLILEPLRQLLKEDHSGEITSKLHLAKNNSERLLHLVNQLLDVSKLEAQKMSLNLEKGYIMDVIEPIFQSFWPLAERKKLKLQLSAPEPIDTFYFDSNHIEKIVYNLLSNAIKYTSKGNITLKVTSAHAIKENAPKNLIIKVTDKGIGIPKAALPYVFDRFYQVKSGSKRQQGTGIGLALTKELVELMDGDISVKSSAGKGTTFTVVIPMLLIKNEALKIRDEAFEQPSILLQLENVNPVVPNIAANASLSIPHSSLPLVLLIEDNNELRHFIKQSIIANYQVIEAADGVSGLEKANKHIPDLIISDLMMPKKDGFQVVKELKTNFKTSHIPIILLTAKTAIASKLEGLSEGADDYLTKPFNTEELLVRMSNLIKVRQQLQTQFTNSKSLNQPLEKASIQKAPSKSETSTIDDAFISNLTALIQENLSNSNFSVEILAEGVSMSRSQLFRKMKAITNQTPNEFIRNHRLDQGLKMLQSTNDKINQIAAAVGFLDEKYFSKRFKERFGRSPREVRR